jgi:hypothetical protein
MKLLGLTFVASASAFAPLSRSRANFALRVVSDPPEQNLVTKEANIKETRRTKPVRRSQETI